MAEAKPKEWDIAELKPKDWDAVESLFDYGLDVKNRRVFLLGGIEEEEIGHVIKGLYHLDGEDSKAPIELFIGSFGGSLYEMFGLYDVLNSLTAPIHTVALLKCMSAAPLLVAAGKRGQRYSMPNTQWMIHLGKSEPDEGRNDELKIELAHFDSMTERWCKLMHRHTKKTAKQWDTICKQVGDKHFDAEQAVDWGLVDHIWSEK